MSMARETTTDRGFQTGDPVWVWTYGAWYPGIVVSIDHENNTGRIEWVANKDHANVTATDIAADTDHKLTTIRAWLHGPTLKVTACGLAYYDQMLAKGFENVLIVRTRVRASTAMSTTVRAYREAAKKVFC